jgi:hypothetical protein
VETIVPSEVFATKTFPSRPPLASKEPSKLKASAFTESVCPMIHNREKKIQKPYTHVISTIVNYTPSGCSAKE